MESLFRAISIEAFGVWAVVLVILIVIVRYQTKRVEEKDKAIQEFLTKFVESEKQNVAIFTKLNETIKGMSESMKENSKVNIEDLTEMKKEFEDEFSEIAKKLQELHYNFQTILSEIKDLSGKR